MGIGTVLLGASLGLSLFGARKAKKEARQAQQQQLAFDARSARLQAKSLLEEAVLESKEIRREGKLLGEKQRALTAKAGAKIGTGTAADIQAQTKFLTEKDVTTVMEAATRKGEQLIETYGAGSKELISRERLGELKKFETARGKALEGSGGIYDVSTALQEGAISKNNFIKSKTKKQETLLTGL